MSRLRQRAYSGIRWSSLLSAVNILGQIAQVAVLGFFLSAEDFGLKALAVFFTGFVTIFIDMGVSNLLIQKKDIEDAEIKTVFTLNIFFGMVVFIVFFFAAPLIGMLYREPRIVPILRLLAVNFITIPLGTIYLRILERDLDFRRSNIIKMAGVIVNIIISIVLAIIGFRVYSIIWGIVISEALKTLLFILLGQKRWKIAFGIKREFLKESFSFGIYQLGGRVINYTSNNLDKLILGFFLGVEGLGYYSFAVSLIQQPVAKINPIINSVSFPLLSRIQDDQPRLRSAYLKIIDMISILNFPLVAGIAVLTPVVLPLVYGSRWLPAIPLIEILAVMVMIRAVANPIGSLALAKGKVRKIFFQNVMRIFLQVPILMLFSVFWHETGAAFGVSALQIATFIVGYFFLIRPILDIRFSDFLSRVNIALMFSLISFFAVRIVYSFFGIQVLSLKPISAESLLDMNKTVYILLTAGGFLVFVLIYLGAMFIFKKDSLKSIIGIISRKAE
ncbi:MAG: MOP flippase family protein [Spirochaetales bacterium]|nr:MOP flippase family protein [Spirochaetales bacterium]